ncbi:MAG: hypothetical protein ACFFBV_06285 [Promethearchaeota archaeon]
MIGIIEKSKKINKKQILKSKITKWGLIFGNLGYFSVFLIGILIAIFIGPNGYNPYYNAISDLGNSYITPFPFLFDLKAYIGSFLFISIVFLVKKKLADTNPLRDNFFRKKEIPKNLIKSGLTFGIIGAVGYTFVGIFNLDRPGPNGLYHGLFAVVTFGGLIISTSIFSFYILVLKVNISKIFAIYGLTLPFLSVILWFVSKIVLFEWISFFSILGFLMPFQSKRFIQGLSNVIGVNMAI